MQGAQRNSSRLLLLTNDDGIEAPGLAALVQAMEGLGARTVIAPLGAESGCAHRVTTHRTIAIEKRDTDRYAIEGSPADCVRLGLNHIVPALSWVVSGINAGGNLGTDLHHSGTVAAVREGVIHGRPGVAISQYIARGRVIDWERAGTWAHRVIESLLERPWEPGTFWNVNLPHPESTEGDPQVIFCPPDPSPLPLSYCVENEGQRVRYQGDYQSRARVAGSDVDVCFSGQISVSLIRVC
ncbi:MAG: 5'/3'-nucleotidase SurE [Isosphaeraceae bacterium]